MTTLDSQQLVLAFPFEPRFTFQTFVAGSNHELVARLEAWPRDTAAGALWIHGERRTGCTHLLQAACAGFDHAGLRAGYVPSHLASAASESLRGLEVLDLVALDDLEAWLGVREVEEALFSLYRSLTGAGGKLLIASHTAPGVLAFRLPDLASRLRAGSIHRLELPDDVTKGRILLEAASRRGLELPPDVLRYLFTRGPRDLGELLIALDTLDRAALAGQRRVTLPLARDVLGL